MNVNVAAMDWSVDIVTLQVLVPEQPPPDQPMKVEPLSANPVRVTIAPSRKWSVQVAVQTIPVEGSSRTLVTVPLPPPENVIVSERYCGQWGRGQFEPDGVACESEG